MHDIAQRPQKIVHRNADRCFVVDDRNDRRRGQRCPLGNGKNLPKHAPDLKDGPPRGKVKSYLGFCNSTFSTFGCASAGRRGRPCRSCIGRRTPALSRRESGLLQSTEADDHTTAISSRRRAAVADRLRDAHVPRRRLQSRRQGCHRDLFDEVVPGCALRFRIVFSWPPLPECPSERPQIARRRTGVAGTARGRLATFIYTRSHRPRCRCSILLTTWAQLGAAHLHTRQSCVGGLRNSSLTEQY